MYDGDMRPQFFYNNLVEKSGKAGVCISCGQCEAICPQHLPIIDIMKEASENWISNFEAFITILI